MVYGPNFAGRTDRLFHAFTVKEYTDNRFVCELQVQSRRPVYNSSYTTTLINFKDTKVEFNYQQYEPLVFSETSIESNLTAVINFYVYMILGVDFDSFSPMGELHSTNWHIKW